MSKSRSALVTVTCNALAHTEVGRFWFGIREKTPDSQFSFLADLFSIM